MRVESKKKKKEKMNSVENYIFNLTPLHTMYFLKNVYFDEVYPLLDCNLTPY